jgi:hypothetical protein
MRRIDCPIAGYEQVWIGLPDVWRGKHALRRDEAIAVAQKYKSIELTNFCIALAVLEAWEIPGLNGNDPEKWQVDEVPLSLIGWISEIVLLDLARAYEVPKNS